MKQGISRNQRQRLRNLFERTLDLNQIDKVLDDNSSPLAAESQLNKLASQKAASSESSVSDLVNLFTEMFPNVSPDVLATVCRADTAADTDCLVKALCEIAETCVDVPNLPSITDDSVLWAVEKLVVCFPSIGKSVLESAVQGILKDGADSRQALLQKSVRNLADFGYVSSVMAEKVMDPYIIQFLKDNTSEPLETVLRMFQKSQTGESQGKIILSGAGYTLKDNFGSVKTKEPEPARVNGTSSLYRELAFNMHKERVQEFGKAVNAWKAGGLTGKAAASFYSTKGRALSDKMDEYNQLACSVQIIENKQKFLDTNDKSYIVDLHGIFVSEIKKVLDAEIAQWLGSPQRRFPLVIITGRGLHSKNQEPKLFPNVKKYLQRSQWKFEINGGSFIIKNPN